MISVELGVTRILILCDIYITIATECNTVRNGHPWLYHDVFLWVKKYELIVCIKLLWNIRHRLLRFTVEMQKHMSSNNSHSCWWQTKTGKHYGGADASSCYLIWTSILYKGPFTLGTIFSSTSQPCTRRSITSAVFHLHPLSPRSKFLVITSLTYAYRRNKNKTSIEFEP